MAHEELKQLYALDEAETDEPWERWEYFSKIDKCWAQKGTHPQWDQDYQYRRKPGLPMPKGAQAMNQEITMDKRYRTRDGREVEILKVGVNLIGGYSVVGLIKLGDNTCVPASWMATGQHLKPVEGCNADLVEVTLQVDDKVMVRNHDKDAWERRYFAAFTPSGKVATWDGGAGSWVFQGNLAHTHTWNHWRLPSAEELA